MGDGNALRSEPLPAKGAALDDHLDQSIDALRSETDQGLDPARVLAARVQVMSRAPNKPAPSPHRWVWRAAVATASLCGVALLTWWSGSVTAPRINQSPAVAHLPSSSKTASTPPASLRVLLTSGELRLRDQAAGRGPWEAEVLPAGEGAILAEGALLHGVIGDRARVIVHGPARFDMLAQGKLRIHSGYAAFSVRPDSTLHPFVVRVGDRDVTVRGTVFAVKADGGRYGGCHVQRGRVEVGLQGGSTSKPGTPRMLGAGEQFEDPAYRGQLPWSGSAFAARKFDHPWWSTDGDSGWVMIASDPAGAVVRIDDREAGLTPVKVRLAVGSHGVTLTYDGYDTWHGQVAAESTQTAEVHATLVGTLHPDLTSEPRRKGSHTRTGKTDLWAGAREALVAGRCDEVRRKVSLLKGRAAGTKSRARAAMLVAECHLRRGQRERALAAFGAIARRYARTPSGKLALYEQAKLLGALGQRQRALATFERFARQWPDDALAAGATFRRCELLIDLKRLEKARACLHEYRKHYPRATRNWQSLLLQASIARKLGEYDRAIPLYHRYLKGGEPKATNRELAQYQLIYCMHRAEHTGLEQAIESYLEAFPKGRHAIEVDALRQR